MSESYRIADEPVPGNLTHFAVNPIWPFFAMLFGGCWLSWPWFLFNNVATGSPELRKEATFVVIGFAGSTVLALGLVFLFEGLLNIEVNATVFAYLNIVLLSWKLLITYWLYTLQTRTFEIYVYYDGRVRTGLFVILLGFLIWPVIYKFTSQISLYLAWIIR